MNRVAGAVSCFDEGFSCAQAVASTYGPEFGLSREMALKVSGAFGGGMAGMGETCGAVTGALMVIGLRHGRTNAEDTETKEKAYNLVKEFVEHFKSRNESIVCRELLGCDIGTPEGKALAEERDLHATRCTKLVRDAAEIMEQLLDLGA